MVRVRCAHVAAPRATSSHGPGVWWSPFCRPAAASQHNASQCRYLQYFKVHFYILGTGRRGHRGHLYLVSLIHFLHKCFKSTAEQSTEKSRGHPCSTNYLRACDICRLFYLPRRMNFPGIRCIYWKGCWLLNNHSVEKVSIYYSLYYLGKMNIIDVHNS